MDRKPASQMEPGDEFEPLEFVATPELNQQYLYAEEDFHPRYWRETEARPPLVHPALLLNMSNNARSPSFFLPPGVGNLQTEDETEFLNFARVGKKLRVTWTVVDRFEKRGRVYNVREARVVDEDGLEILRRRLTGTFTSRAPAAEGCG